jgi:hypothetical protein
MNPNLYCPVHWPYIHLERSIAMSQKAGDLCLCLHSPALLALMRRGRGGLQAQN